MADQSAPAATSPEPSTAATAADFTPYPDHPYAALFPLIPEDSADFDDLATDIAKYGQKDPIILLEGKVLDGRNRQRAVLARAGTPIYREFDPTTEGNALDFVLATNLHRRHLTPGQRAALAVDVEEQFAAESKERRERGKFAPQPESGGPGYDKSDEHDRTPAAETGAEPGPSDSVIDRSGDFDQTGGKGGGANGAAPAGTKKKYTGSAEKAAAVTGASARNVKTAKALKKSDPKAFEQVKAGAKTLHSASTGKGSEGSKAAEEYETALTRIEKVCGKPLAKAIKDGSRLKNRKDVLAYAALTDDKMLDIRHLIEHGKPLKWAVHYKAETILSTHRVIDLVNRAASDSKNKFEQVVETPELGCDWKIVVTAVPRAKTEDLIAKAKVGDVIPGTLPAGKKTAAPKKTAPAKPAAKKPTAKKK